MIDSWINYQYTNIFGFLIFASIAWLGTKSDIAKDILALLLVVLLLVPVPLVMYVHFSRSHWIEFIFCGFIQGGLTYLCFIFVRYMLNYHKNSKYIFWK
ncbi:hypothetical protein [Acinetobacter pseudolwoffii]|uniref:hypothetical protein n=1 Tax=Acinetobacter pseudolwoffii TaxID=2053287 RepID=UPI002469713F|nr:hypothetical protein [Acinetobacter pseudolwoffii]MDH5818977.1 hypothetical protein [Acinetobacter pseudolwoffii]